MKGLNTRVMLGNGDGGVCVCLCIYLYQNEPAVVSMSTEKLPCPPSSVGTKDRPTYGGG